MQKWKPWTLVVLSIAAVARVSQMPGWGPSSTRPIERLVAALAIARSAVAHLRMRRADLSVVAAAATLHAAASCVLGPAIAAISLGLVGPLAIGERFGRNARFASLGNGVAAALMGTCG